MKYVKQAFVFACAAIMICACNNQSATENETPKNFTSKNTDSFNIAFDSVLLNYDSLRNAFINWDTVAADKYAALLQMALINVPYEQLKEEDAGIKSNTIAQNAADALQSLMTIDSINNKRRFFYTASEGLYHLIKATGYDKAVIYHKKCPMAFNDDQEAKWLSTVKTIDNPYLGKYHPKYKNAMLECGSVEDTINNMQ